MTFRNVSFVDNESELDNKTALILNAGKTSSSLFVGKDALVENSIKGILTWPKIDLNNACTGTFFQTRDVLLSMLVGDVNWVDVEPLYNNYFAVYLKPETQVQFRTDFLAYLKKFKPDTLFSQDSDKATRVSTPMDDVVSRIADALKYTKTKNLAGEFLVVVLVELVEHWGCFKKIAKELLKLMNKDKVDDADFIYQAVEENIKSVHKNFITIIADKFDIGAVEKVRHHKIATV